MNSTAEVQFCSDSSIMIRFQGEPSSELSQQVLMCFEHFRSSSLISRQLTNLHPAYGSLQLDFDLANVSAKTVLETVKAEIKIAQTHRTKSLRTIKIPVFYGQEHGPDLAEVAEATGLSEDEVIGLHSASLYEVAFLGFTPGFPYLLGLPTKLHVPRKATPRVRLPAGSVAIAGVQAGVYPCSSPAGWQWIGWTPVTLFNPLREPPSLLMPGDTVHFYKADSEQVRESSFTGDSAPVTPNKPLLRVESPGYFSTVQDLGRFGYAYLGVSAGGAADPAALALGNELVGNACTAAAIEMTGFGMTVVFQLDTWIAITGSPCEITLDELPVQMATSLPVCTGQRLVLGSIHRGLRSYLCVHGGVGVESVLGSASTLVAGGWGGYQGRALQAKDLVYSGNSGIRNPSFRRASGAFEKLYEEQSDVLRVTLGPQAHWFSDESVQNFFCTQFTVSHEANRSGIRLETARDQKLVRKPTFANEELVSEGIANGTIQIASSGEPMILFCEQQTTGGYPKIANVIRADWHRLGQKKPGDKIQLQLCTLDEAWGYFDKLQIQLKTVLQADSEDTNDD